MDKKKIPRCSQCAFLNPDEALNCGMCGSSLAEIYPRYLKRKDSGPYYEKNIVRGTMETASAYGGSVWDRETTKLSLITALVAAILAVPLFFARTFMSDPSLWILLLVEFFLFSAVIAGMHRGFLDIVRERRLEPGRMVVEAFSGASRVMVVLVPLMIFILAVGVIIYLSALMTGFLDSPGDSSMSGVADALIFVLVIGLAVFAIFPALVWTNIYTTLATCRALDRRESPLMAVVWTFSKIKKYHWSLFWRGGGNIVTQLIGLAIFLVGLIGALPLTAVETTSVYEWLRLHDVDADSY